MISKLYADASALVVGEHANVTTCNAEFFGKTNAFLASMDSSSNCGYLGRRQFRRAASCTALLRCVLHVVLMRAWKQMFGIAAGWIIASVKCVQIIWKFSAIKNNRETVGAKNFSIFPALANSAITAIYCGSLPRPTFVRTALINFGPKALHKWFSSSPATANPAALRRTIAASRGLPWRALIGYGAIRANLLNHKGMLT